MPVGIIDGAGSGNLARVNDDGRLLVDLGGDVTISGINIDSIVIQQTDPTDSTKNNPAFKFEYVISGATTGVTGSRIGSITQFISTGSFVNILTYTNNRIVGVGSWF